MVLALLQAKGGSGKTVISLNLAVAYALKGLNVLFIDIDYHASATTNLIGHAPVEKTIYAALIGNADAEDLPIFHEGLKGFFIPGSIHLSKLPEDISVFALKYVIHDVQNSPHGPFDVIVVDCPGNDLVLANLACVASDVVAIPMALSVLDTGATATTFKILHEVRKINASLRVRGIIPNRVDRDSSLARKITQELLEDNLDIMLLPHIPDSRLLEKTCANPDPAKLSPLVTHPSSSASDQVNLLASVLLNEISWSRELGINQLYEFVGA
jgi:cellulose biosynthesis protein BcsQ